MENNFGIPSAEEAAEMIKNKVELTVGKAWDDIVCSTRNAIMNAINECKHDVTIPRAAMRGIDTMIVCQKLKPMLESLGYRVCATQWGEGIYINWEKRYRNESE